MVRTILVATDGSDYAKKALSLANDLAVKYKARLVILHVLMSGAKSDVLRKLANRRSLSKQLRDVLDNYEADAMMAAASGGLGVTVSFIPAPRELLEAIGSQIMTKAEAAAAKAGVKKMARVMADGDPADAILACGKREKADMIVLGSRGLGDFKGLILGSVSHKVSARAERTCVTVK